MQGLIQTAKELEDIRKRLLLIKADFPGLYDDFVKSLSVQNPAETVDIKPKASLTQREQVQLYLENNPDSTLREITEATGLERNQVSGLLYTQNKNSKYFYKTTPANVKPAKWRNTLANGDKPRIEIFEGISPKLSIRDRVRKAGSCPSNIDQLVTKSGLTKRQVRGVINAPNEKDDWKREIDPSGLFDEKLYSYRPNSKD